MEIKHGKDYKCEPNEQGLYPVLGTGGIITYIDNFLCDWDCVCIGRKGTINKPIFMNTPFWSVDTLFYTKPKTNENPKFQYYLFETINWLSHNEASGVPSLSATVIGNIKKYIPSLNEQDKLTDFFSILDKRIEKQQALVDALKLYKRGVLKQEIESHGQTEFAIKEIVNEYVEKVNSTSKLPILSSTMSGIFLQEAYFNKQAASEDISGYKVVPYGYFTYRSMSDTGKFRFNIQTIVDCGIVSPAYPVFQVKNNNPRYVEYILNESDYIKNQLLILKEGGTRYALSYTKFLKLNIQLPSIDIQNKIAKQIELFDDLIIRYETILQELYKLKSSLLQQMFI